MLRRLALLAALTALPATAIAQAPAKAPAKPATPAAAPAHQHGAATSDTGKAAHAMHGMMQHGAAQGGMKHEGGMCPMCQAHQKMMAFYKAVLADSVIHARIRDTKALHDQHHEIDELMEKMPKQHAEGGMNCPMMSKGEKK